MSTATSRKAGRGISAVTGQNRPSGCRAIQGKRGNVIEKLCGGPTPSQREQRMMMQKKRQRTWWLGRNLGSGPG